MYDEKLIISLQVLSDKTTYYCFITSGLNLIKLNLKSNTLQIEISSIYK